MTKLNILGLSILAVVLAASTSTTFATFSRYKAIKPKCTFSYDFEGIANLSIPIMEACIKVSKVSDCVHKCYIETHGYLNKKSGRIIGENVEGYFKTYSNATSSFRKAMVSIYEKCANDAGKVINELKANGTTITECKYEGLVSRCAQDKQIEIMADVSQYC